jgi:hypothetical protein
MTRFERRTMAPAAAALAIAALLFTPACQRSSGRHAAQPDSTAADSIAARNVVLQFGSRLKQVPLLAPDSTRARAIQSQYAGLVSPALLADWSDNPRHAAGRLTSSPWPERIEIRTMARKSNRVFVVDGEIVERTSADSAESGRIQVRMALWRAGRQWMIQDYAQGPPESPAATAHAEENDAAFTPESAAAVIRAYYDAIEARDYRKAYGMWEAGGAASGQSMIEFLNGYAATKSIEATIGTPGPMGAAAGSRYVEVPVRLITWNMRGIREFYAGTYTLRRSVVDGATPRQRTWQIYTATLKRVTPA